MTQKVFQSSRNYFNHFPPSPFLQLTCLTTLTHAAPARCQFKRSELSDLCKQVSAFLDMFTKCSLSELDRRSGGVSVGASRSLVRLRGQSSSGVLLLCSLLTRAEVVDYRRGACTTHLARPCPSTLLQQTPKISFSPTQISTFS